ncbi:MAG: proton-conducting transporter membrane subunit [Bacillota bacterium]|nr:proton-conducting transporter membrane subunit [Bacillota bacterium]
MAAPAHSVEAIQIYSTLPLWLVLIPILGSFIVYWTGRRLGESIRNYVAILISAVCFLSAVYLFILVQQGEVVYRISTFLDFGLNFRVDVFGALFTLLSSFIWLLATIFSWTYMDHEHSRNRYYYFLTLTLGGCLGVFLMEDFFGLLLFFELMSIASYILVIHAETEEAMEAGRNYLYLGIIGGLSILTAIVLLYSNTGTTAIRPLLETMQMSLPLRYLIAALFIAGFGIKAGMAPLHIWLPKAHPVAPSPASALLSGIMIKTGAYGIIRVVNMLFTPETPEISLWEQTASLGFVIIWFGIATMFMAAFIALFQTNAKRILAYSSISQMGYILMGVGCAAYLGYEVGALGAAGTTFHIMNHAFFKAGMFMMVGAIYARTHELELSKLGGLYLDFPVTALAFLICAFGISGVPGFNGYASKTLLHHAIVDAYEHHHVISLYWAEKIFTLTSGLTVCYITKLYTSIFFGPRPINIKKPLPEEPLLEKIVFGIIALGVIVMGIFPSLMMKSFVLPSTQGFIYDAYKVKYLLKLNFFSSHDLQGIAVALGLGIFFFIVFSRSGAFSYRPPGWLSVEHLLYRPAIRIAGTIFTRSGKVVNTISDGVFVRGIPPLELASRRVAAWEDYFDPYILQPLLKFMMQAFTGTARLIDQGANGLIVSGLPPMNLVSRKVAKWDDLLEPYFLQPFLRLLMRLYTGTGRFLNFISEGIFMDSRKYLSRICDGMNFFDRVFLVKTGAKCLSACVFVRETSFGLLQRIVNFVSLLARGCGRWAFSLLIKVDYDHKGETFYHYFNILNFDFAFILLFVVLVSLFIIGFLFV